MSSRRVILEGTVIVASILLAFAIDALWERRSEQVDMAELAQLLRVDITADIKGLRQAIARADTVLARVSVLVELGQSDDDLPSTDSLAALAVGAVQASTFEPTLSAFSIASSSTGWDRMPRSVQVELSEYVAGSGWYNSEADLAALEALVALSGEHGGLPRLLEASALARGARAFPTTVPRRDDLVSFIRDPRVHSWLVLHWGMMDLEHVWRTEWVGRLEAVEQELADSR